MRSYIDNYIVTFTPNRPHSHLYGAATPSKDADLKKNFSILSDERNFSAPLKFSLHIHV